MSIIDAPFFPERTKSHFARRGETAKRGERHVYMAGAEAEQASMRPRGQEVKTSPFRGGNMGSIPVGVICNCISVLWTLSSVG